MNSKKEDVLGSKRRLSTFAFATVLIRLSTGGDLRATTIDFEGFPDSTVLTTQYSGVTFTNTIILTSGISLNELEFPPYSGVNVGSDSAGPITIDFATPITSFSGYFTYLAPLTLAGYDNSDAEVASATSAFLTNDALFGDTASSPNEFIELSYAGAMSSVTITGGPLGSSFTMDNIAYDAPITSVPEPLKVSLVSGLIIALGLGFERQLCKYCK